MDALPRNEMAVSNRISANILLGSELFFLKKKATNRIIKLRARQVFRANIVQVAERAFAVIFERRKITVFRK
jgi:hypothetical protein